MGEVHDGWDPGEGYAAWSDAQLVDAVGAADRGALHELFVRHEPWLATRLSRRCADPALVDTAVQDTFLAAWMQIRSVRGETSERSWLSAIAWRKANGAQRSWVRRRARDTVHHQRASAPAQAGSPIEDQLAVRQALLALPLEQRAAVTLCLVCGCSHSEASAIIGVALGTVKSHVSRGREQLRRALEGKS